MNNVTPLPVASPLSRDVALLVARAALLRIVGAGMIPTLGASVGTDSQQMVTLAAKCGYMAGLAEQALAQINAAAPAAPNALPAAVTQEKPRA